MGQSRRPGGPRSGPMGRLNRGPRLLCQPQQEGGGPPSGGEDAGLPLPVQGSTGEGHGDAAGLRQKLPQHQPLLGRKVGKAVHIHVHAAGVSSLFQPLRQPGEPVPGVGGGPGGQGVVGPEDEPQVPQLLPLPAPGLLPRPGQGRRSDLILLALVQCGQQASQESWLAGGALIDAQMAGHRLQRGVHQQQPPAGVQGGDGHAAHLRLGKDPAGQPGEGQHLGIEGDLVPRHSAQGPLGIVAGLLRHENELSPLPAVPGRRPEHGGGLAGPRPAQQQLQHGTSPFLLFPVYQKRPRVKRGKALDSPTNVGV